MILLTGATGFIGRSVQKKLAAQQIPYRVFESDISDFMYLRELLADVDTIIHLAGAESSGRKRAVRRVDLDGTNTLIRAARFHNISQLIFLSRLNATPHAMYKLLRAKGEAERLLRQSGLPYTIIRSATLFGKDDRFTNAIAATATWSWPFVFLPKGGDTAMQPLWVEDLASCIVAAIGRNDLINETIELAGNERLHYRDIVRLVLDAAKISRRPISIRPQLARTFNFLTAWLFLRPMLTRFDHDRMSMAEITDLNTVSRHFGFQPARFHSHLAHLRRHGAFRRLWGA
ncbi:MAG: NAD(P)H-binding protein [Candidatus Promineifilaceae bacterium]